VTGETVVAIHQPNFFPWLGYFDKIARADVFVVLDSVQFPKKQGTWMNRVRILVQGVPRWITVPVDRAYHDVRSVREMRIAADTPWRERTLETLRHSYARARCFDDVWPRVEGLVLTPDDYVADFNLAVLGDLVRELGLENTKMVCASQVDAAGTSTERLVALTRAVGGTAYLCGGGAGGYQDDERFAEAGLELRYQDFVPHAYPQVGAAEFVPGLSVLDALFNVGFDGTADLLGVRS
jgi:hypothetical protein